MLLVNKKKIQAAAWNVAIRNFTGEALVHVDAHGQIPKDFISKNVKALKKGYFAVGGARPNICDVKTPFTDTLLLAEQSMFGSSIASYRRKTNKVKTVSSLFNGMYKREVFEKVGLFNEKLIRTEDNEMNYRIRKAGFKLYYLDDIISYQNIRPTLLGLIKQKMGDGFWVARTKKIESKAISTFHLVPFAFTSTLILLLILAFVCECKISKKYLKKLLSAYFTASTLNTIYSVLKNKDMRNKTNILLPFIFFVLHFSYGIGSISGFASHKFDELLKGKNNG